MLGQYFGPILFCFAETMTKNRLQKSKVSDFEYLQCREIEHKLPAVYQFQLSEIGIVPDRPIVPCNDPGCSILTDLEGIQELVRASSPYVHAVQQLAHENAVS